MQIKYLYFLLCVNLSLSCHFEKKEVTEKGSDGITMKYKTNKLGNADGLVKYYSKSNKLVAESNFENGMINGSYKIFNESGTLIELAMFTNDIPNGYRIVYNENGQIQYKDYKYFGLPVGGRTYYKNGIFDYYQYTDFNRQIIFKAFYKNGNLVKAVNYENLINNIFINKSEDLSKEILGLFIYKVSPPNIKISYNLCSGDTNLASKKTVLKEFISDNEIIDTNIAIVQNTRYFIEIITEIENCKSQKKYYKYLF